jgi:hypothetical protein
MKLVIFYLTFKSRATKKMRLLLNLEIYFQSIRALLDYKEKVDLVEPNAEKW